MDVRKEGIQEVITKYKGDVEKLIKYLPWLLQNDKKNLKNNINPDENGSELSMKVPVYDSTLLAFIKTARTTSFINRNYVYTYSTYRIKTAADELKFIERAQIMDMQKLGDILSKYVIKGMTKGSVWSEGMEAGVYCALVSKMKELIEFWTVPM